MHLFFSQGNVIRGFTIFSILNVGLMFNCKVSPVMVMNANVQSPNKNSTTIFFTLKSNKTFS